MQNKIDLSLSGKVTVITGAAGGLGRSIAEHFALAGSIIFLTGLDEVKLQALSDSLSRNGFLSYYQASDIRETEKITKLINTVINKIGCIDILVNCAGINRPENAEDVSEQNWNDTLDINLKATFFMCQAAGREMIKQRKGKIINISSQSGIVALPSRAAYCSSKGGVNQLTRALALEWAQYNINVNAIAPTFVETPFTKKMLEDESFKKYVIENIPLGKMPEPKDIAYAALFLASDFSNMITGHILSVDGGWTIK